MSIKMNTVKTLKDINLPIIKKGKLDNKEDNDGKNSKIFTAMLIIFVIILLLFCGYSMARALEEVIVNGKAEVAEPILVVENNPSIDITAEKKYGEYAFKIKNYNQNNSITQTDLKYYIEILSNNDNSICFELYQGENKIDLKDNKTEYIQISKDSKEEREYIIKIKYDKNVTIQNQTINDILDKIQVRVHSEQVKA